MPKEPNNRDGARDCHRRRVDCLLTKILAVFPVRASIVVIAAAPTACATRSARHHYPAHWKGQPPEDAHNPLQHISKPVQNVPLGAQSQAPLWQMPSGQD